MLSTTLAPSAFHTTTPLEPCFLVMPWCCGSLIQPREQRLLCAFETRQYRQRWYSRRRNVRPSVRLSVCLSLRYCIKTKKASIMISSPSESPIDWCGYELAILAIFHPINHRISETVQDRTKVAIDHQ